MTGTSIQDTVNELREARTLVEKAAESKDHHIQQLEIKVQALTAELDSINTYYGGINALLDRLATVKGAVQQQRIAVQIMELRNRKSGLKKVERPET